MGVRYMWPLLLLFYRIVEAIEIDNGVTGKAFVRFTILSDNT